MKQKVSGEAAHGSGATLVGAVGSFFDKEKRKNNLVVHNLPESDSQDPKERASKDLDAFKGLIRDEFHLNVGVSKAFRAGKVLQDKPRPLIVTLDEESAKWELLRLAPQLRESNSHGRVFLSPDRTPEEREQDRMLRLEAKKHREEGKTVRIHRGKVVVIKEAPKVPETAPTTKVAVIKDAPKISETAPTTAKPPTESSD